MERIAVIYGKPSIFHESDFVPHLDGMKFAEYDNAFVEAIKAIARQEGMKYSTVEKTWLLHEIYSMKHHTEELYAKLKKAELTAMIAQDAMDAKWHELLKEQPPKDGRYLVYEHEYISIMKYHEHSFLFFDPIYKWVRCNDVSHWAYLLDVPLRDEEKRLHEMMIENAKEKQQ